MASLQQDIKELIEKQLRNSNMAIFSSIKEILLKYNNKQVIDDMIVNQALSLFQQFKQKQSSSKILQILCYITYRDDDNIISTKYQTSSKIDYFDQIIKRIKQKRIDWIVNIEEKIVNMQFIAIYRKDKLSQQKAVNYFVQYNDQVQTKQIQIVQRYLKIIPRDARMKDEKKKEFGDSNKMEVEEVKNEEKRKQKVNNNNNSAVQNKSKMTNSQKPPKLERLKDIKSSECQQLINQPTKAILNNKSYQYLNQSPQKQKLPQHVQQKYTEIQRQFYQIEKTISYSNSFHQKMKQSLFKSFKKIANKLHQSQIYIIQKYSNLLKIVLEYLKIDNFQQKKIIYEIFYPLFNIFLSFQQDYIMNNKKRLEQNFQYQQFIRNFVQIYISLKKINNNISDKSSKQNNNQYKQKFINYLISYINQFFLPSQVSKILIIQKNQQQYPVQLWITLFYHSLNNVQFRFICAKKISELRKEKKLNQYQQKQIVQIFNQLREQQRDMHCIFLIYNIQISDYQKYL